MTSEKTHSLMASSELHGTEIRGETGEPLGKVDHLVLDLAGGRIAYAVIAFGGVLGIGGSTYSVPWDSLRFNPDDGVFVTAITRQQIETAPDRPADWYRDRGWESRTFEHFGARPYWF